MQSKQRTQFHLLRSTPRMVQILTILLIVVMTAAACSSGPPADSPPGDGTASEQAPAADAQPAGPALDEYQTQRQACTDETPCWPEIVDTLPSSFNEAPMLAERVAAGELPPVEERLPRNPLVIQPTEMIGEYGGVMRGAFTGPGDRPRYERWNNDYTIFWDTGATELQPRLAYRWEANEDATQWTFYLREGLKWSDGEPFTADDYIWWYDYILTNEQLVPAIPWYMQWGGELAQFEKVDDYTFTITFAAPFPSWPETMASEANGYLILGRTGGGLYAPQHYLEQFHADVVGEETANAAAQEAGYENWALYFVTRSDATMNLESPVMTPWKPVTILASNELVFERNPYFWAVDTEGNQLPYFDGIALELVEELEVLNLRAIAGNYTIQGRHIDFAKLPVIRENSAEGNYFVDFWNSSTRNPIAIYFNVDWNEDPEVAEYTAHNVEFRRALSLAIEREEINETFFLGVGTPASLCPANTPPYFNSDRWDEEWAAFDPEQANQILDEIGLDQRDGEGYRLLPSGVRLVLRLDAVSGSFLDYPGIGERISQMWREYIGIDLVVNPVERSLWVERTEANQPMMNMFETGEFNPIALPRLLPSERWAPVAEDWANVPNPDPAAYDGPEWVKEQVAKHWEAMNEPDLERRQQLFIEATEIMCDNQAALGVVVDVPVYTAVIKNNVRNVPKPLEWVVYGKTPGNGLPEQFFMLQDASSGE